MSGKDARLARVIEKGFIDFPTAFEIVADADEAGAVHHDQCSWHAGMLCDCHVLTQSPEYLAAYGDTSVTPAGSGAQDD